MHLVWHFTAHNNNRLGPGVQFHHLAGEKTTKTNPNPNPNPNPKPPFLLDMLGFVAAARFYTSELRRPHILRLRRTHVSRLPCRLSFASRFVVRASTANLRNAGLGAKVDRSHENLAFVVTRGVNHRYVDSCRPAKRLQYQLSAKVSPTDHLARVRHPNACVSTVMSRKHNLPCLCSL
jgi:hypothetical protein